LAMEHTFVVSGGRKNIKKHGKTFFLPEVFVENEEGIRQRTYTSLKHSTPKEYQEYGINFKERENLETTIDSGYEDWSINTSHSSRCESVTSDTSFKTPSAKPVDDTLWESLVSPVVDLKRHFKSKQSFVDNRVKFKINVEHLVTGILSLVLFSSIVFSVYMGTSIIPAQNGKLRSIKYGATKRMENLRAAGKIIENDIKDEAGNTLGGKKAAIQFAYNQNQEPVRAPKKTTLGQAPRPKSKQNPKQNPKVEKKVVPANVEDAKPLKKATQQLGIAELSRKIDELNTLLQGDMEEMESDMDLDKKIKSLKERKKALLQKIKPQKVQPPKARKAEPSVSKETVETVAKVKPGKTKVENPLTKSIPKKSKAKKIKKVEVVEEMVEDSGEADVVDADDTAEEVIDNADADIVDNTDIDDGFNNSPDYPDDPTFRGTIEI